MVLLETSANIESIAQLVTMILIFVFVLVLTYLTSRFVGSLQKQQMCGSNIQIIETTRISNTKYLQIVQAGGKYILIAVCKDTVTYLCDLKEEDLNLQAPSSDIDFKSVLARFKNSGKVEKDEEDK